MAHVEQQHADAILIRLAGALPVTPPLVVYDGEVPADPDDLAPAYVLVYMYTTRPDGTALTNASDRAVTRAVCHCVAGSAKGSRAVAGRVASTLLDFKPTIEGRVCFPIRDDNSPQPPQPDNSTGALVMDQVITYRLESLPA